MTTEGTTNNSTFNLIFIIIFSVPPKIGETTRLLTYSVAEEAKITCPAIGIPPPEISWMKDGRTINTALLKYDIEEFGTLLIHDLTVSFCYLWLLVLNAACLKIFSFRK